MAGGILKHFISICLAHLLAALLFALPAAAEPQRIVSLDACADQYVLGLAPLAHVVAVSDRATLPESWFRDRVGAIRKVKPKLETILALRPDAVVRTWGGDAKLLQALQLYGVKVININEVSTYSAAKDELFRVGHEMNEDASASIEAHNFDDAMDGIRDIGHGRTVLYYTPSGYTAGPDTMQGDMLRKLGFRLETQDKGYAYLSPEVLLSLKPDVFALGFYDDRYAMRRVPGRNPLVRAAIARTRHFTIPARALACNGWYTVYDLENLSLRGVP